MISRHPLVALAGLVAVAFVAATPAMGFTRHGQSMGSFDVSNPGRPNGGFGGYPMWSAPGGFAWGWNGAAIPLNFGNPSGMTVWIPAIVGVPAMAAVPPPGSAPSQAVLCVVEPTNPAVSLPAGQKVVVIADSETACDAISGTVSGPAAAGAP